jgi:hypothetical protein
MNKEIKNIEDVEAYLSGDLKGKELEAFEARIKFEPDLKKDLTATQNVIEGIEGYAFKQWLETHHTDYLAQTKSRTIRLYYISGIAASILLLICVVFVLQYNSPSNYYTYFKPYPENVVFRGDHNPSMDKALQLYDQGDFKEALVEFEKNPSSISTEELQFFKAQSYLAIENPDAAGKILKEMRPIQYKEQVQWYLALCYLLNADKQAARKELKRIQKGEYEYENAQILLSKMQ